MRIATLVVVALMATSVVVSAQTPYIAVYFDAGLSQESKDCPGSMPDVLHVAAINFNQFVIGAEFAIQYPPAMLFMGDLNTPPVTIGNTQTGISMGWPLPLNGFAPIELCQVSIFWQCAGCDQAYWDNPIRVVPNPNTNFLGMVNFPQNDLVPSGGLTAIVCPHSVPTEETTWGQVKALYGE
jgi:hypothetical protein